MANAGDLGIFSSLREKKRKRRKGKELEKREGGIEGAEGAEVGRDVDVVGREVDLELWNALEELEVRELRYRLPGNYFDEMKLLTEFGMLHRFPIDNEQDWYEEFDTDFTEHVFLEKHLDSWCPQTGPLRHFMELITTGLSKNPYISVEKKKEHIMWYRDYFISKSSLLREVGLELNVDEESKTETGSRSQNERK